MQINRSILLRGRYANIGDYVALTKPRVMSLVVFTALVGLMVAPGSIDPFAGVLAFLCMAAELDLQGKPCQRLDQRGISGLLVKLPIAHSIGFPVSVLQGDPGFNSPERIRRTASS